MMNSKGGSSGLIEVLSHYLPGGTKENREDPQYSRYPGRDGS
jgi:hypothetical protein